MQLRLLLPALLLSACATSAPPEGVSPAAMATHMKLLTLDTHLDTPALFVTPRGYDMLHEHDVARGGTQVDGPRMRAGGLDGGFFVVYTPQGPLTPEAYARVRDTALLRSLAIHELAATHPDEFELALTSSDAARIAASGKIFAYQSIENSYPLGEDITLVDTFYKLGVRMIGPVHNGNNQFADSNADPAGKKWNGLSPLGKQLVKRANELGMVLDGSHASDETIMQMADLSTTPIILSHHGARALFDHPRNSTDAVLKHVAAKGGVIQMNTLYLKATPQSPERVKALAELRAKYPNANELTGAAYDAYLDAAQEIDRKYPNNLPDFEDYMKATLYMLKLVGPKHVGFGADWDGGGGLNGFNDVSLIPKVTARLLAEGYSEADLADMWSGNVLRLMKAAEDAAKR